MCQDGGGCGFGLTSDYTNGDETGSGNGNPVRKK